MTGKKYSPRKIQIMPLTTCCTGNRPIKFFLVVVSIIIVQSFFNILVHNEANFTNFKFNQIKSRVCPTKFEIGRIQVTSLELGQAGIFANELPAPFSDELKAAIERNKTNYEQKISYEMARSGKSPRPVRLYTDGIYDLFHAGHGYQLMQAKNLFPNVYLIVGVCNDSLTHELKGCTVMEDKDRFDSVRHCRYVDEVVRNAPWGVYDEFLDYHKIDFVVHGQDPHATDTKPMEWTEIYAAVKSRGMYVETKREPGLSTSFILDRILTNHDIYKRRNEQRGFSNT